jgi:hypothetical protein
MADEVDKLVVSLELNIRQFEQSLNKARAKLDGFAKDIGVSLSNVINVNNSNIVNNIANTTNKITSNLSQTLKNIFTKVYTNINRTSVNIRNSMRSSERDVTESVDRIGDKLSKIFTGGAIVAGIYASVKLIKKGFGLVQESAQRSLNLQFTSSLSRSGVENLQKLQNTFALMGGNSAEAGSQSFNIRNRILTSMGKGGDIDLFRGLAMANVNPYDRTGKVKSGTDLVIDQIKGIINLKDERMQATAMDLLQFNETQRAMVADPTKFYKTLQQGQKAGTFDTKSVVDKNATLQQDLIGSMNALRTMQDTSVSKLSGVADKLTNSLTDLTSSINSVLGIDNKFTNIVNSGSNNLQKFMDNPKNDPWMITTTKDPLGFFGRLSNSVQEIWHSITGVESSYGVHPIRDTNKFGQIKSDTSYGAAQITPQRAVDVIKRKENRTVTKQQAYELIKNQTYANELSKWEINRLMVQYGGNINEVGNDWHSGRHYDNSSNNYVRKLIAGIPMNNTTTQNQHSTSNSNQSTVININGGMSINTNNPSAVFNHIKDKATKKTGMIYSGALQS